MKEQDTNNTSEAASKTASETDWEALAAMTDEEIDYSEIGPLPETFFERARIWQPQPQVTLKLQVDADILDWFRKASDNWEGRMRAALRLYVESHRA